MIKMTMQQAATILNSTLTATELQGIEFQGMSIDTRTIKPKNLFVAIPGSNYDGHDFLQDAHHKGAACALVSRFSDVNLPQIMIKDATDSLGKLSSNWRKKFQIPFIAVTGSNGKTTLKNMIYAILTAACHGDKEQVLATIGTLNNHLGLPLTLARLNAQHRYAVLEMGMNHFGEIEYLSKLAQPDIAVITNAAACHLDGVGDIAGVAKAKSEIFIGMSPNGIAILNRDDEFYSFWRNQIAERQCLTFGFHPKADVRASYAQTKPPPIAAENISEKNQQAIILHSPFGHTLINLPLLGKHNVINALAASAAALSVDISLDAIKIGLENALPEPGRLQLHTLPNGVRIIDDTYNANPFSLQVAVETLSSFIGKKILVLGDMKELGHHEKLFHETAGEIIRQAGIDYLFTYGKLSEHTSSTFGEGAYHFNEQEKLINALKPFLFNQTTILIKGSRSMHMERVIAELVRCETLRMT